MNGYPHASLGFIHLRVLLDISLKGWGIATTCTKILGQPLGLAGTSVSDTRLTAHLHAHIRHSDHCTFTCTPTKAVWQENYHLPILNGAASSNPSMLSLQGWIYNWQGPRLRVLATGCYSKLFHNLIMVC